MVKTMALADPARRFSLRPSRPAVQKSKDAMIAATPAVSTARKLDKVTTASSKRISRNANALTAPETISSAELREREKVLREWWAQYAEPYASRLLNEHEYEAFYASAVAIFIDRSLTFNQWTELRRAFDAAVKASKPAPSSEPDYWNHHGTASASIMIGTRRDGW